MKGTEKRPIKFQGWSARRAGKGPGAGLEGGKGGSTCGQKSSTFGKERCAPAGVPEGESGEFECPEKEQIGTNRTHKNTHKLIWVNNLGDSPVVKPIESRSGSRGGAGPKVLE